MSTRNSTAHPVALRRGRRGWAQETLAARAGIPRSSLSAIEAGRLTPSVATALAVARALECSVEELFDKGRETGTRTPFSWAWEPRQGHCRYWEAEVGGREFLYPVELPASGSWAHDGVLHLGVLHDHGVLPPERTLVLAGCDPAAGLLAAEYAVFSSFRLLGFSRGGGAALELLKQQLVHVAALHRSTPDHPTRNLTTVQERLGSGYKLLRCAEWQEGVAAPTGGSLRSVKSCVQNVRRWAVREPGTAARECLDELLDRPLPRKRILTSHHAVADAVRSGWAEAGVCIRLCAEDAGLRFHPIRTESLDLCFAASIEHDPRIQALIQLLRSRTHRRLINELPGYDARHMGEMTNA